ncbi:MAG: hypothetical protein JWO22_1732 [Frankiales bacterium]|nr:hypothetical protein [Frankiales bacterium]
MTELRVIRGDASPEELAAVVAILAASGGAAEEPEPEAPSLWAAPQVRAPLPVPGPGAWTASGLRL